MGITKNFNDNVFLIEQWCESVLMEKLKGLVLKK